MTIMMKPFMSVARARHFRRLAAILRAKRRCVFSLYVLGIVMAVITGLMLKHTIMRRSLSVCDGAAGLPRPAYQEPDHPGHGNA